MNQVNSHKGESKVERARRTGKRVCSICETEKDYKPKYAIGKVYIDENGREWRGARCGTCASRLNHIAHNKFPATRHIVTRRKGEGNRF